MIRTCILLVICLLPSTFAESSTTLGQSLDKTIQMLKKNLTSLATRDERIVTKVDGIIEDVKRLQMFHDDSCSPCKIYQGSTRTICDCTGFQPQQDCLAFNENGFKVNGMYPLINGPKFAKLTAYCD